MLTGRGLCSLSTLVPLCTPLISRQSMIRRTGRLAQIVPGFGGFLPRAAASSFDTCKLLVDPQSQFDEFHRVVESHVFLTGAVHEGKTSFALQYAEKHPTKSCYIGCYSGFNEKKPGDAERMADSIRQ